MPRIRPIKELLRRRLHALMSAALRIRSKPYPFSDAPVALIIAPHQDDATLGCGGLIARKRLLADAVHVAYITDGGAAYPNHPTLTRTALAVMREAEARRAMQILGVDGAELTFLGASDGTLLHLGAAAAADLVLRIGTVLEQVRPDEVFLPCRHDGSSEHDAVFVLVARALAASGLRPRVMEYPIWARWNPRRLIRPLFTSHRVWRASFRGLDATKQKAIAAYVSQLEPLPPETIPALSPQFLSFFLSDEEIFFENKVDATFRRVP